MLLVDWLAEIERNSPWLAEQLGLNRSYVHKIKCGDVRPSNEIAAKIHELSGGKVTSVDHERAFHLRHGTAPLPSFITSPPKPRKRRAA